MKTLVAGVLSFLIALPACAQTVETIGASAPPNGAAGGDLSGTYPNPNVASIGGKAVTLGGALTTSGAFATTLTVTGATNVTLPTSGTVVNTGVTSLSSLATVGTLTGGGTGAGFTVALGSSTITGLLTGTNGGTGVNNGTSTITLGASMTTTGAGAPTLAFPGSSFTYTFQGSSDTILGRATTDTLTNKTYDTAGTGNVFKINGTQITAVSGTGAAALVTNPIFVGPTLGVATGTSLALNGSLIGSNVMTIHGTTNSNLIFGNNGGVFSMQAVNDAGAALVTWELRASSYALPSLTTGTNADVVCIDATFHLLIQAAVSCTISSKRFKNQLGDFKGDPLNEIMALGAPQVFTLKDGDKNADWNAGTLQVGFYAEDVARVDAKLAIYEPDHLTPKSYRQDGLLALSIGAIQELKFENNRLNKRISVLEKKAAR